MKLKICEICHKPAKHVLFVDGAVDDHKVEDYYYCSFKCLSDWLVCTEINKEHAIAEINQMINKL